MHPDGRVRDLYKRIEVDGDEYTIYFCWKPVDNPNSNDVYPEQIPSEVDGVFYEIHGLGYKSALHKTSSPPTKDDILVAKYKAANRPDYVLIGLMALPALILFWLLFLR